jgi:hypothetical protein
MNIRKAQMESSKGFKAGTQAQAKRTKDKKRLKGSYLLGKKKT